MEDIDASQGDICRVCRCEAQTDRPLFYPCICTGSIKYIHQDCLMQWMRYSHKEYCELCGHRFSFQPIYSPDMPRVLPLRVVLSGILAAVGKAAKSGFHNSLVGIAWFGIVPLSAYRTYRYLFRASTFDMILSLPLDMFSTENLASDAFRGCFVVTCTLLSFVGMVWLREQILHGGGPDWLERDDNPAAVNDAEEDPDVLPAELDDIGGAPVEDVADGNINPEAPVDIPMNNAAPAAADPDVEPEMADQDVQAGGVDNENDNDEPNWNPMELDRAAEELTWERLLGLDGSLVFLEHVFWIIALNTLFIFSFAFCPYCIGNFILTKINVMKPDKPLLHFHGLITTLFGYCFIGLALVVLHFLARVFRMRRIRWLIGHCYILVKVSLLSVVEIGGLPLICGWWLDICSLPLFDATIKDRISSFNTAPGTSLFVHWMFGMVYVYYFAAFISLLREVLRPDVLWFLRNLNDPNFSPIQEMIHLPLLRHVRRLMSSAIIFGSVVLLMLWLPIRVLKVIWPTFLPYTLSGDSEVNELNLQLLLLQIILPGFFEQSHTRIWLKGLLRLWCVCVAWVLGIHSYLLGKDPPPADNVNEPAADGNQNRLDGGQPDAAQPNVDAQEQNGQDDGAAGVGDGGGVEAAPAAAAAVPPQVAVPRIVHPMPVLPERNLAAMHQALMQRDVPVGFQPYDKPTFFALRLCGLLIFICASLVIASLLTLSIPVWIGRQVMALWSAGGHITNQSVPIPEVPQRPHELYTAALGTYLCWILSRGIAIATNLFPQGRAAVLQKTRQWLQVGITYALPVLIVILMLGVIPLMFGLLLELIFVIPLRVPTHKTPIHFLWQDWALGVLYTKIAIAMILMGPDWHMKRAIERAYRDGLGDINLKFLIQDIAYPVITFFGLALSIPYVVAHSILPLFIKREFIDPELGNIIYSMFFSIVSIIVYIYFEINQFKKLYAAIKVDRYLVGQRLVNYEHRKRQLEEADAVAAAEAAAATVAAEAVASNSQEKEKGEEEEEEDADYDMVAGNIVEHDELLPSAVTTTSTATQTATTTATVTKTTTMATTIVTATLTATETPIDRLSSKHQHESLTSVTQQTTPKREVHTNDLVLVQDELL